MKSILCFILWLIFIADIDECAEGIDTCDSLTVCMDTPGSYTCACNSGYIYKQWRDLQWYSYRKLYSNIMHDE